MTAIIVTIALIFFWLVITFFYLRKRRRGVFWPAPLFLYDAPLLMRPEYVIRKGALDASMGKRFKLFRDFDHGDPVGYGRLVEDDGMPFVRLSRDLKEQLLAEYEYPFLTFSLQNMAVTIQDTEDAGVDNDQIVVGSAEIMSFSIMNAKKHLSN